MVTPPSETMARVLVDDGERFLRLLAIDPLLPVDAVAVADRAVVIDDLLAIAPDLEESLAVDIEINVHLEVIVVSAFDVLAVDEEFQLGFGVLAGHPVADDDRHPLADQLQCERRRGIVVVGVELAEQGPIRRVGGAGLEHDGILDVQGVAVGIDGFAADFRPLLVCGILDPLVSGADLEPEGIGIPDIEAPGAFAVLRRVGCSVDLDRITWPWSSSLDGTAGTS